MKPGQLITIDDCETYFRKSLDDFYDEWAMTLAWATATATVTVMETATGTATATVTVRNKKTDQKYSLRYWGRNWQKFRDNKLIATVINIHEDCHKDLDVIELWDHSCECSRYVRRKVLGE